MRDSGSSNKTVCFFDSGIGGLNLLWRYKKRRENYDYIYVADNYNVPYGSLSHTDIMSRVHDKFAFIGQFSPDAAVIACNTVTAECIEELRKEYSFPIVGMQPAVKPAAAHGTEILVLATPATAASPSLAALVERFGRGITRVVPCSDLAAEIERNIFSPDKGRVFKLLPEFECDGVVLGCTHYIYAADLISEFYGCPVYDGVEGTLNRIDRILAPHGAPEGPGGSVSFYGGDVAKNFKIYSFLYGKNNG